MVDDRKMEKARFTRMHSSRPTIGLLIGRLGDVGYAAQVWPGVADVAEERDVNLICFVGGALQAAHEFDSQRNVVYDLASPENVDGLIAMSGSIGQFIGPEQLKHFYKRYHPLPMVSVAMALDGIPSVLMDNKTGMRDAINHLIEVHKFSRIAFIRGPETNPEAEERYHTYAEVLAEHGIPLDPDLVAPGNFLSRAGEGAIRLLLDERKADFEAVASANDEMAFGAMTALRERGTRVPDDVSVVGFDDLEEAGFAAPPLTTIRQPLYEQGRRAAEMLLALLAGENAPERVALPTELVVRQSCGCFPQAANQASKETERWTGETIEATFVSRRERILSEMVKAANNSAVHLNPGWAEKLLDAFSDSLEAQPRDIFLPVLDDVIRQVGAEGDDVMQWHRVLDVLRYHALPSLASSEVLSRADALWQRAGALIGEVAQWAQAYRRLQAERRAFDFTTRISEPLMTAFDMAGLTDVVAHQLPQMGIMSCYLALYEQPVEGKRETPTEWSRLILAYNRDGRIELETDGRRFLSRQLVPEGILSCEKRFAVMLEPLHFRDEIQLGFIIFEPLQTEAGALREALSRQISTALKGALLLQERRQAEQAMVFERNLLRSLLDNTPDMIWFMDQEVRYVATSKSHARYLGVSPEDMIGKTNLNFYPNKLAEEWIEHEKYIMKMEEPMIGKEEKIKSPATGEERWVSTTKILRYDENGNVIGTLGLSRDITEIKEAAEALKKYSERLEEIVEERTAELQDALQKAQMADRMKSEFLANVNHELRTPLTNLILYYQMLSAYPSVKTNERLGVIGRELQRLRSLIENLLNLSRLELEQVTLRLMPHDINKLIQSLANDRSAIAEERGLTLITELFPTLPSVWLDEAMIVQAVSNLLTNAMNYTPAGGQLYIRTMASDDQSGKPGVAISVQDTGPGIDKDDLPHIFERFYRGSAGRETGAPGTGLGLAIVKEVVERHHGHIEVENVADGHGAVFKVWLPVEQGQEAG